MGVPLTTARVAPLGIALGDGYSTKIAFAADDNISFFEKTVKPPGIDGGDGIEVSTMHNTTFHTMRPRSLVRITQSTIVAAYDPSVLNEILALVNVETDITVHFPDGDTFDFFGYLQTFEPQDHAEGSQPEANITITPTNIDPGDGREAGPVATVTTGT